MALDVEDGSGKPSAISYVSLQEAEDYFALRGMDAWPVASEVERQAALVRASFGLDTKYRGKWIGQKRHPTQRLAWPRSQVSGRDDALTDPDGAPIPTDAVPLAIKDAACEVAYIELTERFLTTSVSRDDMVRSDKTGPLETAWFEGAQRLAIKQFPKIDQMLAGYATADTGVMVGVGLLLTDRERDQGGEYDMFADPRYFITR